MGMSIKFLTGPKILPELVIGAYIKSLVCTLKVHLVTILNHTLVYKLEHMNIISSYHGTSYSTNENK